MLTENNISSDRELCKPTPTLGERAVRVVAEQLVMVSVDDLIPYANNARIHDKEQISRLRASLREFGFVTPLLIDFDNHIIAGHGRLEAARAEGLTKVPCVLVSNLTESQRKAYILADNRLSETAIWDTEMLRLELEELDALKFDISLIGFDTVEVVDAEARPMSGTTENATLVSGAAQDMALDLDIEPTKERTPRTAYHCPKCGFEFEV